MGRTPTYDPRHHVPAVREMSASGWSDFRIAKAFDVSTLTIYRWRKTHPEFAAASVATEQEKLDAVRGSLFARAMGYSHDAVKIMTRSVGDGCSEVLHEAYVEHYPPDVGAIKFYLTNKSAGEFTDKQEVEQSGGVTVRVVGGLPDDDENVTIDTGVDQKEAPT